VKIDFSLSEQYLYGASRLGSKYSGLLLATKVGTQPASLNDASAKINALKKEMEEAPESCDIDEMNAKIAQLTKTIQDIKDMRSDENLCINSFKIPISQKKMLQKSMVVISQSIMVKMMCLFMKYDIVVNMPEGK
jgi:hypothetical protein